MEKPSEIKLNENHLRPSQVNFDRIYITDLMPGKDVNYQEKIEEYYKSLKTQVNKLDSNVEFVLKKHEQDFLNAFKCQMFNLNSQLRDLKKKTDENEVKLKKDEQINKLQTSLDWFKEEAVKLGESSQYYKREYEKWKTKAETFEKDREFLENQLKKTKKELKLLRIDQDRESSSESSLKSSVFQTFDKTKIQFVPSTKTGEIILSILSKSSLKIEDFLYELEILFSEQENKYNETVKHLKNSLEAEKKKFKAISAQQSSVFLAKNELENLFLDCVEEVKKDINKRRAQTINNQKFAKRALINNRFDSSIIAASDKRRMLELLVSNEQILVFLYEKLFPHRANYYPPVKRPEEKIDSDALPEIEELIKTIPSKPSTARNTFYSNRRKSVS